MPNLASNVLCSGCTACFAACPRHAIAMVRDAEGFLRPQVKADRCVNCGLCERACPVLSPRHPALPLACVGAKTRNDTIRAYASSGGIFMELAMPVIQRHGVVYGCVLVPGPWDVRHVKAADLPGVEQMCGSKYVQSDLGDVFRDVKKELDQGREVLFTGTPCQIAGLKGFLGGDREKLLTVGVICHGAPSRGVFHRYLRTFARDFSRISFVGFRSKFYSWRRFAFSIRVGERTVYDEQAKNVYMRLFNGDVMHRLSCYACKARAGRSGADLLIGDFWGVERVKPDSDDGRGLSAILAYTEKGQSALSALNVDQFETTFENVIAANRNIQGDVQLTWRRRAFYRLAAFVPLRLLCNFFEMSHLIYWKRLFYPCYKPIKKLLRGR